MPWCLRASLEAPGLHDTNLNTLSTQTPRGQKFLGHKIVAIKNNGRVFHEKGFTFHAQPQAGAYS